MTTKSTGARAIATTVPAGAGSISPAGQRATAMAARPDVRPSGSGQPGLTDARHLNLICDGGAFIPEIRPMEYAWRPIDSGPSSLRPGQDTRYPERSGSAGSSVPVAADSPSTGAGSPAGPGRLPTSPARRGFTLPSPPAFQVGRADIRQLSSRAVQTSMDVRW